jgi:hypothetical protein
MDPAGRFARAVLIAVALAFAGPGLGFLLAPARFAALVDVALIGPTGFSDARAVLGGMELGFAAFLATCAVRLGWQSAGLIAAATVLGGMLTGRALSAIRDGSPGGLGWLLFAIEVALTVAALVALARVWLVARDPSP